MVSNERSIQICKRLDKISAELRKISMEIGKPIQLVPSRFYPFLVQVENTSAFVYMMVNTNGTFWIRCVDWDGNKIANTSLSVVIFCIDSQAISNWRTN